MLSLHSQGTQISGKILTIVTNELQTIDYGIQLAPFILIAPLSGLLAFVLIYLNFKEAAFLGLAALITIVLIQLISSKLNKFLKQKEAKCSDERINSITDAVSGIKTIKTECWEEIYAKRINEHKRRQSKFTAGTLTIISFGLSFFKNGGLIIAFVIFGYHYAMGRQFEYSTTLATLTILAYLSDSLCHFLFLALTSTVNLLAALKRCGEIMNLGDDQKVQNQIMNNEYSIEITNASFSW